MTQGALAVDNKLARRNSGWATLSGGYTPSEKYHGAVDFSFVFDTDMYALQFQAYQICDPDGCVDAPHSSINFLYGKAMHPTHWSTLFAQTGAAIVQLRKDCHAVPNGAGTKNICNEELSWGVPFRAGVMGGHFIGLSLELTALLSPKYQVFGGQVGIPLGVF